MRNFSRPEVLDQLGMQPLHAGLEGTLLPGLEDVGLELGLDLEVDLLDARRVDAAVLQQPLQRQPRDLTADAVEAGEHDGTRACRR